MQLSLATKPPFAEFDLINRQMQLHNWDPANVIKVASSLSAQQKWGIIKRLSQRLSLFSFFFKKSPFPESKLWLLWGLNLRQATFQPFLLYLQCSVSLLITWTHSILALQRFTLPLGQRRGGGKHVWHNTGSNGSNYLVHNNRHVWNDIKVHLRHVFWAQHMHIPDHSPPLIESPLFQHRRWLLQGLRTAT